MRTRHATSRQKTTESHLILWILTLNLPARIEVPSELSLWVCKVQLSPGPARHMLASFWRYVCMETLHLVTSSHILRFAPFCLYQSKSVQAPDHYPSVPFRQLYEIVRVAGACKLDINHFLTCFQTSFASYDGLWSSLSSVTKALGAQVPERSSLVAWNRAISDFEGVALTGKLKLLDQPKGPCFEFQLSPLKLEPSYRLSRQFGSDRFCVLAMPGLGREDLPSHLKQYHTCAREVIINWLVDTSHKFLGRTWRAFYTKNEGSKRKGARNSIKDSPYRIYLFAEDGVGFRGERSLGETDPRLLDRPRKTVRQMMEWFMPFKANLFQPSLKFFARLALGLKRDLIMSDCC